VKFDLTEDQQLLRSATSDFLAAECPIETSRQLAETPGEGFSRKHWAKLAELGYLGLCVSERSGGQGLGPIELAIVCHQLGRVCFPGPYLDVVLAAKALDAAGGKEEIVKAIVAGESIVVIARQDTVWPTDRGRTVLERGRVTGTKYFVPYGASADRLVVLAGDDVALVDGPFECLAMPTIEEAQRFAEVRLDHPAEPIGAKRVVESLDDWAAVGAASIALGLCEAALERSVAYSRQRETFGKPIGSYQVLQHRMADMLLRTESSRSSVYRAAWALARGDRDATLIAAAAKAYAVESAGVVTRDSVQIHGGNGFTWEYDLHCFLKRATTLDHHYGATAAMADRALRAFEATL
jgi:alkylation response protein AidB-like acyl-CoA dehydrogenase